MSREALPNKRHGEAFAIEHFGHKLRVHVNEYPDGRLGEIFINASKPNSQVDNLVGDIAILFSLLLQHGARPADIGHALRRDRNGGPQSFVGVAADVLIDLDAEASAQAAEGAQQ
jgi:hypothetical protein